MVSNMRTFSDVNSCIVSYRIFRSGLEVLRGNRGIKDWYVFGSEDSLISGQEVEEDLKER